MSLIANQTKYGLIKAATFTLDQGNPDWILIIKIDPTHNEWRSVVVEIFIKTFKNKTYKYMASISKNVYFDKLANIIKGAL